MNKKIPMRKCIGCQESKAKKDLVRMVTVSYTHLTLPTNSRE